MKRETPTEREIADLIASAFEGWTAPNARRLAAIEQRLPARARSRGGAKSVWWWLAGALLAGAASALWWAVGYDSTEGQKQPMPAAVSPATAPSTADLPTPPGRFEDRESTPADAESKPTGEPAQKRGVVIYQREQ